LDLDRATPWFTAQPRLGDINAVDHISGGSRGMKRELNAVGQWYLRRDTEGIFQVIDCDERSGTIRIQTFDGDLDEIEEEFWRALPLEPVEPPEDWTGPLDNVEPDDLDQFVAQGYTQPIEPADYREPWEALLAEEEMGADVVELGTPERETVDGPRMKRSFGPANRPLKTVPPRPGV
jgi:hypothetical protein